MIFKSNVLPAGRKLANTKLTLRRSLLFISLLLPTISLAAFRPIATLTGGINSSHFRTAQNVTLLAPFHDTFTGSNTDNENFIGLFLGYESPLYQGILWQLGVSYYHTNPLLAEGRILQFADPAFSNISYQEKITNNRIMLETKLLATIQKFMIFHPYVSVGAGRATNTAGSYTETPVAPYVVVHPESFGGHRTTSFTYAIGIGIDMELSENVRVGIGYRYAQLGNAQSGLMPNQDSKTVLKFNNQRSNEFLLTVSFLN
jgi:opacity protein-like surface antigen